MAGAVQVHGLGEAMRALSKAGVLVSGSLMANTLRETAEKVAESSRDKISRYQGASLGTIKPGRISPRSASVYQNKRKVTGKRGDFGALQMTRGLIPALEENEAKFTQGLNNMINEVKAITGL